MCRFELHKYMKLMCEFSNEMRHYVTLCEIFQSISACGDVMILAHIDHEY